MAIKNTSFAKGEAVQKLIEVIARVNNKSVAGDTALQTAIDEVREMFKSDEMTVDTYENIMALAAQGGLEPGHMYTTTIRGEEVSCIANDKSSFFGLVMVSGVPGYCDDFENMSWSPLLTEVITTVDYDSAMQRITDQGFYRIINRTGDYVSDVIVLVTQPQLHPTHEVAFGTINGMHLIGHYNYSSDTFTPYGFIKCTSAELDQKIEHSNLIPGYIYCADGIYSRAKSSNELLPIHVHDGAVIFGDRDSNCTIDSKNNAINNLNIDMAKVNYQDNEQYLSDVLRALANSSPNEPIIEVDLNEFDNLTKNGQLIPGQMYCASYQWQSGPEIVSHDKKYYVRAIDVDKYANIYIKTYRETYEDWGEIVDTVALVAKSMLSQDKKQSVETCYEIYSLHGSNTNTSSSGYIAGVATNVLQSYINFSTTKMTRFSLHNLPITAKVVNAEISAAVDGEVSVRSGLPAGYEITVIAKNVGENPLTITFPEGQDISPINLEPGKTITFSCVSLGDDVYKFIVGEKSGTQATTEPMEEFTADEIRAMFD